MALALRFGPRGKSPKARRIKAMQLDKATKVLKLCWKAVVWAELAIVMALILWFSQFFSSDVFISKFQRQASAETSVQP
jgi:hypothetical protein